MNTHVKKEHPDEAVLAATVLASATEDETDTELMPPAKDRPPYIIPQPPGPPPQPQPQLTAVPQTPQPQG